MKPLSMANRLRIRRLAKLLEGYAKRLRAYEKSHAPKRPKKAAASATREGEKA